MSAVKAVSGRATRGFVPTLEQEVADDWARQSVMERLPRIRDLGGKWTATVGALTGLFGAGTIIGASDIVHALQSPWDVYFGLLALAGLIAAATSTWFASRVEQPSAAVIPFDVKKRAEAHYLEFTAALDALRRSKIALGVALVLFVAAFALGWYGPQTPPDNTGSAAKPLVVRVER